jgi:hypothetical protein
MRQWLMDSDKVISGINLLAVSHLNFLREYLFHWNSRTSTCHGHEGMKKDMCVRARLTVRRSGWNVFVANGFQSKGKDRYHDPISGHVDHQAKWDAESNVGYSAGDMLRIIIKSWNKGAWHRHRQKKSLQNYRLRKARKVAQRMLSRLDKKSNQFVLM